MPSGQLDNVMRHLRRMAGVSEAQRLEDGQLLEQYVSCRDEDAFAALVYRYGRLVRSVCRHILHHEQDIDDAFQATFLIFACKAASIRRASSVASWLYGVAYRTAMNAKRTRARRREKQHEPDGPSREQPVREAALREIQAILNEEVQRLPERYRAPFILCCLEGKGRAESAQQLGLKEGTVSSRLAQARKLLQQRLGRRGVALSAALCAVEVSRSGAAANVGPMLMNGTIEGGLAYAAGRAVVTDLLSAEAAALAKGAMQTMSATTLKAATAVLLTVGLATGAGLLACHVWVKKPAAEQQPIAAAQATARKGKESPADPKRDNIEFTTIRGRVLDPDDKPVSGAKLYLAKQRSRWHDAIPALSQQATSGSDGRFRLFVPKADLEYNSHEELPPQIMAVAEGYGCDWVTIDSGQKDLTLRLAKDVLLGLRILDLNGRPVVGAKLTVTGLWKPKGNFDNFVAAVAKDGKWAIDKRWYGPLPERGVVTTGGDGRFRLAGAGLDRIVELRIEGPAIATSNLRMMTHVAPSVATPKNKWSGNGTMKIYGASSDYIAAVSRPIRGVVRDKETGKPLQGVSVSDSYDRAKNVTDKDGRFELVGLAKASKYYLEVRPPDGSHFQRRVILKDTLGLDPLTCDIELVRGLMVRGRVTDKETHKPIVGAEVKYCPLGGNSYVNKLLPGYWVPGSQTTTDPDGSYALTVMPGPGALTVTAPKRDQHKYMPAAVTLKERKDFFKTTLVDNDGEASLTRAAGDGAYGGINLSQHNAVVLLEPDEKEKGLVRDVALHKPMERKGRVLDPDGRPLAGVRVCYLNNDDDAETLTGAEFTVRGINPRKGRTLVFYHKEKDLGYYLKDLRRETAGPLTIKLQQCGSASGRILSPDGKPLAGLHGLLYRHDGRSLKSEPEGGVQSITTDKDGRFRVEGLVPGQEYRVANHSARRPGYLDLFVPLIVKPGEHKEMGDLKMHRSE